MTEHVTSDAPATPDADPRPPASAPDAVGAWSQDDLRVARVLLRSGNALSARVHLETLAGRRGLDVRGLLDLAESRWRTGDLGGAGEAVAVYLEAGGHAPLGHLIAAEAAAALGRPGEARQLARQALEGLTHPLDAVFAGQPRSGIWPHDPAAAAQPAGTLFAPPPAEASHGGRIGLTGDARLVPKGGGPAARVHQAPGPGPIVASMAAGPADEDGAVAPAELEPERGLFDAAPDATRPDVRVELDAARADLAANDYRAAAVRLAVVLRLTPALAPAVLDLVGQLPGPDFDLLRGDALRLVGHEAAAGRAFAAASDAIRQSTTTRSPE